MCCYIILLDVWRYVMNTNFSTDPEPTKPIKPTFYRLWGFMLDMFEVDGGLKAQSLSKVVFSEMRDSQMGTTNLFTPPETKKQIKPTFCGLWGFTLDAFEVDGGLKTESLWKVGFIGFVGSGTTLKLVFLSKSENPERYVQNLSSTLHVAVFWEEGLRKHLWVRVPVKLSKSLGSWFCWFFWFWHCKSWFPQAKSTYKYEPVFH